ncbi:MAG: hypothetical protein H6728_05390 [Myxococcales bacterium]|nr:hypothetical protein [Myxococcales bacterium]
MTTKPPIQVTDLPANQKAEVWLQIWQQLPLPKPTCPPPPCQGCQRDPKVQYALHGELGIVPDIRCQSCPLQWKSPEDFAQQQVPMLRLYAGALVLGFAFFALWWRAWPSTFRIVGSISCVLATIQIALGFRHAIRKKRGLILLIRLGQPISTQSHAWPTQQLTAWLDQTSTKDPDYTALLRFIRHLKDRFSPLWQLLQHARLLLKQRPLPSLKRLFQQAELPEATRAIAQERIAWLEQLNTETAWQDDLDQLEEVLQALADLFQARSLKIAHDTDAPPLQQLLQDGEQLLHRLEQHIPHVSEK